MRVSKIHVGQYKRYGDSFDVYEISDVDGLSKDEIIALCNKEIVRYPVPTHRDWLKINSDPSIYFTGYCELKNLGEGKWEFTHCRPYAD